jgi:choline dehydrogenase-like flavoprotein
MGSNNEKRSAADFVERVRVNQRKLSSALKSHYDFIVCGSGSSGSVVARRLAENPEVSVLLLEAGGSDDVPSVTEAARWFENLGTERDWAFVARPNPHLKGRSMPLSMGKVLGGGSSINVMFWARGHRNDWDFFASESGDPTWDYESVLNIYRRMEDWQYPDDPIQIEANTLSHPDDLKAAVACVELCREIGNSAALRPFTKREVMPGDLSGAALEDFIRDAASTYHHQTCTAKMGRDSMSVVDGQLKVYGIENLRIADGSIMPRDQRQHHGSLHHHRRACRRGLAERAQVRGIVDVAFCARLNDSLQFESHSSYVPSDFGSQENLCQSL